MVSGISATRKTLSMLAMEILVAESSSRYYSSGIFIYETIACSYSLNG